MTTNEKLLDEKVYVKSSNIHGTGIFTSVDIKEGEIIMKITGDVIDGNECMRREDEEDNVYIFYNGEDCYIDTSVTKKIKFINHNCDYNCDVLDGDETYLLLTADRDISAGEELTIDYGYEEIYEFCNCQKCNSDSVLQD